MMLHLRSILLGVALALSIGILLHYCSQAQAAGPEGVGQTKTPIQQWFETRKNSHGGSCCGLGDGHPFYSGYALNPDGSATLNFSQGKRWLEPWRVLTGPNPTGHPVVWYGGDDPNVAEIYCFAPGSLM